MPEKNPTHIDVRMRGFSDRALVSEATHWIDQNTTRLPAEDIPLTSAHARILATNITANINVPAFRRSAMDGFALKGEATTGAGNYNILTFQVIGESLPGSGYHGTVCPGQAVRIMTGAPIPPGADAVVPAEYAQESNETVGITTAIAPGKHVAQPGEDITAGTQLAQSGRRLRPQDLGLFASVGLKQIPAIRRPHVRLLVTGNELVQPGDPKTEFQIFDANSVMLSALIERDGGTIERCQHLQDHPEKIRTAMTDPGADVILVAGGSSVGIEDHAPTILATEGKLAIHGIAIRPASPTGIGRIGETLVFLLPGNPVSCLCAYDFFARTAIRLMGGQQPDWPYPKITAAVGKKIVSAVGRVDYVRVRIVDKKIEPIAVSGASILSTTTRADGFVVIPETSEGAPPGKKLTVHQYDC